MTGKLKGYLAELDGQAEMFSRLVKQMANREGVNERLEADDQMAWVGRMNSIRARAREIRRSDGLGRQDEQHPRKGTGDHK